MLHIFLQLWITNYKACFFLIVITLGKVPVEASDEGSVPQRTLGKPRRVLVYRRIQKAGGMKGALDVEVGIPPCRNRFGLQNTFFLKIRRI